jgi:hypothetical protein
MNSRKWFRNVQPALERLEDRTVPSVSPFGGAGVTPSDPLTGPIIPPQGSPQITDVHGPNGDQNPYGVAFVPKGFVSGGSAQPGDILVSNFNNSTADGNLQGTGTTIMRVTPSGQASLFFQGQQGLGLTTALGVLRAGFVVVGSVPTSDGMHVNPPGSLLIIDKSGNLVTTLSDPQLLDGPWDLTVHDGGSRAQIYVSNVLNGTITRINLRLPSNGQVVVESMTRIGSNYKFRTDPAALVVGPTGLAYDNSQDLLYVASTGNNSIYAISNARTRKGTTGRGSLVYHDQVHLHGPLGLLLAPNGDLITANGDAVNPDPNQTSEIVEFTPSGQFVAEFSLDPSAGGAFGIAIGSSNGQLRFAAVEDVQNTLEVWNIPRHDDDSASVMAAELATDLLSHHSHHDALDQAFADMGV